MKTFLKTLTPVEIHRDYAPSDITFSAEQQKLVDLLKSQIEFLKNPQAENPPPRLTIVQGKAGSGKSTIIKEIVRQVSFT